MKPNTPPNDPAKEPAVDFAALLWEELAEISVLRHKRHWVDGPIYDVDKRAAEAQEAQAAQATPSPPPPPDRVFLAARNQKLVGLAFSGGGIRSATFNLGVLQGFAKLGLLPMFDYLSTVSGGGYIGSWLTSWIYRAGDAKTQTPASPNPCDNRNAPLPQNLPPIRRVQEALDPDRSQKPDHGEPKPIRFLREYSNYLTPRLGFLGADTWTAIAIYLRNVLLNQSILVLFLLFLLLLPYIAVFLAQYAVHSSCLKNLLPFAALTLILIAQFGVARNMTHLTGDDDTGEFPPSARQGNVLGFVVAPVVLAACFLSAWLWSTRLSPRHWWFWPLLGACGFGLTWSVAVLLGTSQANTKHRTWNSLQTAAISIVCSIFSSAFAGLLLWVLTEKLLHRWCYPPRAIWHVVSFGPPLTILVFLLVVTLQLGLMGIRTPDPRREWWGRLMGWLLIVSAVWAAFFALAIYSPLALMWSKKFVTSAAIVWVISTLTGVLGGKSGKTGAPDSFSWKDTALSVMPYVFIVGLGAALATLLESVLALVTAKDHGQSLQAFLHNSRGAQTPVGWMVSLDWQQWLSHFQGTVSPVAAPSTSSTPPYVLADWQILQTVLCHPYKLLLCISVVAVACLGLAWRVDLNEFSMNLFYRNRLVRCYLGASRKSRRPNPFTGFDPDDDLYVGDLRAANCYSGPFPIINTTLNLVKGQNLAWQQRKAESFVVTPFRCGFDTWLERLDLDTESEKMAPSGIQKYAFRPAGNYAYRHGLRVGTAVSISGAAASPNMGYHSSPSLAFLMTFFNVRLGFWAGNPRNNSTWTRPGPRFSLFQLLTELFGLTDDEASYVYLSDGGHFENLGLYELIKRRCRYIVVCDADCDGSYAFGDLGNAIQKCREDVGVEITMATTNLTPQKAPGASGDAGAGGANGASPAANVSKWHWAIGEIQYSLVDPNAEDGILVYLKASLTGDEPVDVLNYHRQHPDFPHETTADQWFTESQFESYRRLGQHVVEELFAKTPDPIKKGSTGNIFESLKTDWPTQLKRPCTCRVP